MTSTTLLPSHPESMTPAQLAAVSYLARYTGRTHTLYAYQLRRWFNWCQTNTLDPLVGVQRAYVELYIRHLHDSGLRDSSINTMPETQQSSALRPGPEAVDRSGRDEHEGARAHPLCWIGVGVERVGTFQDVEGFCFIVDVRWVVESRVLLRLAERPVSASLGSGCFAGDVCLNPIGRMMLSPSARPSSATRSLVFKHFRPPGTELG